VSEEPKRPARRGLGAVAPGEAPTGAALLAALGGVRGLVESILPGLVFLVVFALSRNTWASAIAPLAVTIVFVVVRIVQRSSVMSALVGLVIVGISAASVLLTGDANQNFLPGIWINIAFFAGLLISLVARWPLVGLVLGAITGDLLGWRRQPLARRAAGAATWIWLGLFAVRLSIEVPLYLAHQTDALAIVRLVTGVPLYAATLWVTWLLLRGAWAAKAPADETDGGESAESTPPEPR